MSSQHCPLWRRQPSVPPAVGASEAPASAGGVVPPLLVSPCSADPHCAVGPVGLASALTIVPRALAPSSAVLPISLSSSGAGAAATAALAAAGGAAAGAGTATRTGAAAGAAGT